MYNECYSYRLLQPILLGWLIRHYEGLSAPLNNPLVSGGAIVGVAVVHIFVYHPFNFLCRHLSLHARIASSGLIYRKVWVRHSRWAALARHATSKKLLHTINIISVYSFWSRTQLYYKGLQYDWVKYSDRIWLHVLFTFYSSADGRCRDAPAAARRSRACEGCRSRAAPGSDLRYYLSGTPVLKLCKASLLIYFVYIL